MTRLIVGGVLIAALVLASGCGDGGEGGDVAGRQGGDPSLEDVKAAAGENPSVSESCDSLEESVQVEDGTDIEQEILLSCVDGGGVLRYTRYGSPELLDVHGVSDPASVHFRSETVGITFYGSGGGLTGGESLADAGEQRIAEEIADDVRERCDCGEVVPATMSE